MYDVIVVGGGPAGLTAALYARRSGKSALVLEREGFGGQIARSPRVENYPGVRSVSGAALAEEMLSQALELGADTDIGTVTALRREGKVWRVSTGEGECYSGWAVILAVGTEHRRLGLPGEEELEGRGVSYCAVCDGAFYAGKDAAVAGGGNSALQTALLLSDICRQVTVIHRRAEFRGERQLQERLFARENVKAVTPAEITALRKQNGSLCALTLRNTATWEETELPVAALFVDYGQAPATLPFAEVLPLDPDGYIRAGEDCLGGEDGLFAAGDCRAKAVRQLTTATSDGAVAALAACRYLDSL